MLPAWHAILDIIGCFLTNRCQIEKLLFYGYVFGRFGELPIFGCFVPKIISPIHVASRVTTASRRRGQSFYDRLSSFDLRSKTRIHRIICFGGYPVKSTALSLRLMLA
jgi:hypothetical protein